MPSLTFCENDFSVQPGGHVILFWATDPTRQVVVCEILTSALARYDRSEANGKSVLPIFIRRRAELEAIANRLYDRGEYLSPTHLIISEAHLEDARRRLLKIANAKIRLLRGRKPLE